MSRAVASAGAGAFCARASGWERSRKESSASAAARVLFIKGEPPVALSLRSFEPWVAGREIPHGHLRRKRLRGILRVAEGRGMGRRGARRGRLTAAPEFFKL